MPAAAAAAARGGGRFMTFVSGEDRARFLRDPAAAASEAAARRAARPKRAAESPDRDDLRPDHGS